MVFIMSQDTFESYFKTLAGVGITHMFDNPTRVVAPRLHRAPAICVSTQAGLFQNHRNISSLPGQLDNSLHCLGREQNAQQMLQMKLNRLIKHKQINYHSFAQSRWVLLS